MPVKVRGLIHPPGLQQTRRSVATSWSGGGTRVLYGARLIGEEGGAIRIGQNCVVMENAVVRASSRHACIVGDHCLIGPNAHIVGAALEDEVFVATGAAIFAGARIERNAEVRVHATVHLRARVEAGMTVPTGWIAVGDPAIILPPDRLDDIWVAAHGSLHAPGWVYGPDWAHGSDHGASDLMSRMARRLAASLGAHADDRTMEP